MSGLADLWHDLERVVEATSRFPPVACDATPHRGGVCALDAFVDWRAVEHGEVVVKRHVRADGVSRVVAVGVVPQARAGAWLAVTQDLQPGQEGIVERRLSGHWAASPKQMYQRIDLPWPVADRHWVIEGRTNLALAAAEPRVWERSWNLVPGALAGARTGEPDVGAYDASVAVPRNEGGWILVEAGPTRTLAIYSVSVNLGGAVPEGAVSRWTESSVQGLYTTLATDARRYAARTGAACSQPGGDGKAVGCAP